MQLGMPTLSLRDILRVLWFETWWKWDRLPNDPLVFTDFACHYFNLCEAAAWFIFSILVLRRWWLNRRSALEIGYAIAFFLFGVSDVVEAWALTSWLLWWKAVNLTVLFFVRKTVMLRFYPDHRLF